MITWTGPIGVVEVTLASAVLSPNRRSPDAVIAAPSNDIDTLILTVCAFSAAEVARATNCAASMPAPPDPLVDGTCPVDLGALVGPVSSELAELHAARVAARPTATIWMVSLRIARPYDTRSRNAPIAQPAVRASRERDRSARRHPTRECRTARIPAGADRGPTSSRCPAGASSAGRGPAGRSSRPRAARPAWPHRSA